jgi:hypothetical protein
MTGFLSDDLEIPTTTKNNLPKGVSYGYQKVRNLPKTSAYAGFPIFHKIKITQVGYSVQTDRADLLEYWQPFQNADKKVFNVGDDAIAQSRITSPTVTSFFGGSSKQSSSESPGTRKLYGGKQYVATTKRISWSSISPIINVNPGILLIPSGSKSATNTSTVRDTENPYLFDNIQLWILDPNENGYSFTGTNGIVSIAYFWYHPIQKRFYSVPNSRAEQDIGTAASIGSNLGLAYVNYIVSLLGSSVSSNVRELSRFAYGLIPPNSNALQKSLQSGLVSYLVTKNLLSVEAAAAAVEAPGFASTPKNVTIGGTRKVPETKVTKPSTFTVPTGDRFPSRPNELNESSIPQMVQYYTVDGNNEKVPNRHEFKFAPNQISYSGIGSEWNNIPRSGSSPLVDWSGFKLMEVSFQFLLAPDKSGSFDERGSDSAIAFDVEEDIRKLRRMAVAPYPVTMLNFDSLLSEQVGFPYIDGRGVEFIIADLSISSLYRTSDGKINRAQCSITLREIPIDSIPLVSFPLLKFPGTKNKPSTKNASEKDNRILQETSTQFQDVK